MLPPSTSSHRDDLRSALVGPLAAMTTFSLMSDIDRREAGRFWLEALAAYHPDEVRKAFIDFASNSDRNYPNPQEIARIIVKGRRRVAQEIDRLSAEKRARDEYEAQIASELTPEELERRRKVAEELTAGFLAGRSLK